jgi:DNA mismatch repair protein MutL
MEQNRILRLDARTAGKIAAGEVVERPAMVIKELVENAIDAGATEIIVDIAKGGKALIKVTDNGSGIHYDDLKLVFERHATSKIRSIDDLYRTQTLGFRGEALASICAVSNVELITMRPDEKFGMKVTAAGGTIHKISEVGTIQGTTIIVRDLFFNTPARLKFLKADQVEGRAITELMGYLALSHPEVGFKYTSDEKLVFHTQGKGNLANAIFSVFDPTLLKGLYEIDESHEKLRIRGFISRFDYTKGTKSYQLTFVNGRYVKSDLIKDVIQLAYKPYMMNGRHPVCILFIEIPQNEIDVNIHPAKTEIKFHDDGLIKQFVFSALKKAFNLYDQVPKVVFTEREVFSMKTAPAPEEKAKMLESQSVTSEYVTQTTSSDAESAAVSAAASASDNAANIAAESAANSTPQRYKVQSTFERPQEKIDFGQVDFSMLSGFADSIVAETTPIDLEHEASIYDDLNYIGVYNKTYLLYEKATHLFLVDQHAAHEKILFEAFMDAFEKQAIHSQLLLIPEVIHLGIVEMSRFDEVNKVLLQMGFTAEPFGDNSIVLREIPVMFDFAVARRMVQSLFENVKYEIDAHLYHDIAEKACKAAIKAHDDVHEGEQIALIEQLKKLKSPYTCPHGRPIIISFSLHEIEKKFKRII